MPIPSKTIRLVEVRWKPADLPAELPEIPKPYTLRVAGEQELDEALRVIESSYDLDPEWSGCDKYVEGTVMPGVRQALAEGGECLFILHGNRVIAASAYQPEPADGRPHLASGPCVLIEYRNRGLGVALLAASLKSLRDLGAHEATGLTRVNSPSAKYLATKFGGRVMPPPAAPVKEEQEAAA
jgi:hypothetical protein